MQSRAASQVTFDMRFGLFGGASARRRLSPEDSAPGCPYVDEYHVEAEALRFPLINELFRRRPGRNAPPRPA
jgi:hypothetical protein